MEFDEIISNSTNKSTWVNWLTTDSGKAATETLSFLSICYSNIPEINRSKIKKRLQAANSDEIDAIIRELVTFELLRRLHLKPEWSPKIDGKNPDLMFVSEKREFIADVFLVKSPIKTVRKLDDIHTEFWDKPQSQSESRSTKIANIIRSKSNHYSKLAYPLVLFAFFADNLGLDVRKVEAALYGITVEEIMSNESYPEDNAHFLSYPNLSAVITCKWFDTSNRTDEGKRLHCLVLHNSETNLNLPTNAFSPFGQVIWKTKEKNRRPQYEGDQNMVAKFQGDDHLEIKPYTWNNYW